MTEVSLTLLVSDSVDDEEMTLSSNDEDTESDINEDESAHP